MTSRSTSKLNRERVHAHRRRLREQGLRPIQLWVPDLRERSARDQAHAQSTLVAASAQAEDDQAFIDSVSTLQTE